MQSLQICLEMEAAQIIPFARRLPLYSVEEKKEGACCESSVVRMYAFYSAVFAERQNEQSALFARKMQIRAREKRAAERKDECFRTFLLQKCVCTTIN